MTTCYFCGSASDRERLGSVRDNTSIKVLKCNACGLAFLSSFDQRGSLPWGVATRCWPASAPIK